MTSRSSTKSAVGDISLVIRVKEVLELPYKEVLSISQNTRDMEEICNSEIFWQEYNTYHYRITPDIYYHGFTAREITKFINDVLDFHFNIGNLVLFESLKDLFTNSFKEQYAKEIENIRQGQISVSELIKKENSVKFSLTQAMLRRFDEITVPFPFSIFNSVKDYPTLRNSSGKEFFTFLDGLLYKPTLYFSPEGVVEIPFDAFMCVTSYTTIDGHDFMDKNYSQLLTLYDELLGDIYTAAKSVYQKYAHRYFS
jgi:hypothetical protein